MLKYPVTSTNNVEYAVEIFEGETIYFAGINIYIYKKREKPSLFKSKYKKLKKYTIQHHHKGYEDFKYDYVKAVEYAITIYEKEILSEMLEESKVKDRYINFVSWDGKVGGDDLINGN